MNDREQFELLVAKDWDAHDLPNFDLNPLGDYVDDEMFSAFAWFKKGLAARATPAQPVPEISYAISVKETGADLVINRIEGDITTVLHSEFHPMGDTYGLLLEAPEDEGPSPSSVGAAILNLPLPEPLEIYWPQLNSNALGCGVEDRNIRDRYEAAEYGWQDGVDRAAECVPDEIYTADQVRELLSEAAALAEKYPVTETKALMPKGWKLVPIEPTEAMIHAAEDIESPRPFGKVYRAMLAAAPIAHSE